MKKLIAIILFAPLIATAGSAGMGAITDIYFMPNGVALIYTAGPRSDSPACVTDFSRFSLNTTTQAGKSQLAGLLLAFASGKSVGIIGTNTCADGYSDTESLSFFHVLP
jgi:hypothetical protein